LGDKTHAQVLDRSSHTGTQSPSSINPQGTGSGLHADLLDGMHATDIIAAATTEAGMVFNSGEISARNHARPVRPGRFLQVPRLADDLPPVRSTVS
jgi:hypothetical protein